jgi:ketosteroid isomerase-like protein
MKTLSLIALLLFSLHASAQTVPLPPNQQSLVDAEWAFINMAKDLNVRDAFIANFNDESIVFNENVPVKAKGFYATLKPNDSWLKWEPVYTDIAASGDFGFNTGPWEFRAKKTDEKAIAFGHFVSVWKKQADGKWKLAVDIGITHPSPEDSVPVLKNSSIKTFPLKGDKKEFRSELLQTENNFLRSLKEDPEKAYDYYLSEEARIYRVGHQPFIAPDSVKEAVKKYPGENYTPIEGDIASTGDLGFVYGLVDQRISETENQRANYMRIWKRADGKHWKIVLEILTYR